MLASDVHRPTILVGRDTRLSGEMLESALVAGICSVGARAVLVEVLPTPAIAYLTRFYEADAGRGHQRQPQHRRVQRHQVL